MRWRSPALIALTSIALVLSTAVIGTVSPAASAASGTISGTVYQPDGTTPFQVFCISLFTANTGLAEATTDTSGNYSFTGLADGTYYVHFDNCEQPGDFTTQLWNGTPTGATYENQEQPAGVVISNGGVMSRINATMQPGGWISGTVTHAVDGTAFPCLGVGVVLPSLGGYFGAQGFTDQSGDYIIVGLAPGGYNLTFGTNQFGNASYCNNNNDFVTHQYFVTQEYTGNPGGAPLGTPFTKEVTVGAAVATGSIDASIQQGGVITGKLYMPDGVTGFPNVCVQAVAQGSPVSPSGFNTLTSIGPLSAGLFEGDYDLVGLAPGNYYVLFNATCGQDSASYDAQYYVAGSSSGTTDRAQASVILVTAGATNEAGPSSLQLLGAAPAGLPSDVPTSAVGPPTSVVVTDPSTGALLTFGAAPATTVGASETLTVPPNSSLEAGTTLSAYPISQFANLNTPPLPPGYAYEVPEVIACSPHQTGITPPIELTITDLAYSASEGDIVYQVTPQGTLVTANVVSTSGDTVTISFSSDPVFVIAVPAARLARPGTVAVSFSLKKSTLSSTDKVALTKLSTKLASGASVTITGYAKHNTNLATSRSKAVEKYLGAMVRLKFTLKSVTSTNSNRATVKTTKE